MSEVREVKEGKKQGQRKHVDASIHAYVTDEKKDERKYAADMKVPQASEIYVKLDQVGFQRGDIFYYPI